MTLKYYYNSNAASEESQIVDKNWVIYYGGIDPDSTTPAKLAKAGFYLYTQELPPTVNPLIYKIESSIKIKKNQATSEYTVVPLPLEESKATFLSSVKEKAYQLLQPSDWMVVRSMENGVPVAQDWTEWREAVRVEAKQKTTTIESLETPEELLEYVESAPYFTWPEK